MKKIFAIMIAVITCFSICSCDPSSFVVSRDSLDNVISVELIEYVNPNQKHFFTWVPNQFDDLLPFVPENATILLLCKGTPEAVYVKFKYMKGQRITQQVFDPSEARITAASSKGIQMTPKQIERIDINKPTWWVATEGNTKGTLFQ